MDTHDVSRDEKYFKEMERQTLRLLAARKRQGKLSKKRSSRSVLVSNYLSAKAQADQGKLDIAQAKETEIHSSFVPPPYAPSIAPLKSLQRTGIRELRLETHHRGQYVLLRTVTPPNRMTAIMTMCEDLNGDVVLVQLYQQEEDGQRPADDILGEGSVIVVKEPYFKVMGDGECGIRVDHVSDFVQLEDDDEMVPEAWRAAGPGIDGVDWKWKWAGEEFLGSGRWWEAVSAFGRALKEAKGKEEREIRILRAVAEIEIECFDAALADMIPFTSGPEPSERAMHLASRALYSLRRYKESAALLEDLLKRFPANESAKEDLERARLRVKESETGEYDFESIYKEIENPRPPHLDHATYLGAVEVRSSPGRGRGLYTTQDVKAGELLICEKAFAHCYYDKHDVEKSSTGLSVLFNIETGKITFGTQGTLIGVCVQKLVRNPSLYPEFVKGYHGQYEGVKEMEVDGKPIIDTFLTERTIALNCFGCPLTSLTSHFTPSNSSSSSSAPQTYHSTGLWPLIALINHSCLFNVRRSFLGDLQLIYASTDLAANTEILHPYLRLTEDYQTTQNNLRGWGFSCSCPICGAAKALPEKLAKRRKILRADAEAWIGKPGGVSVENGEVQKMERMIAAIDATYKAPAARVPRLGCWDLWLAGTRVYTAAGRREEAISSALKALEALGFEVAVSDGDFRVVRWGQVLDRAVEVFVHLWVAYSWVRPELCKDVEALARVCYKMCIGEDVTFERSYGARAREGMPGGKGWGNGKEEKALVE